MDRADSGYQGRSSSSNVQVMIKDWPGADELEKFKLVGLVENGASLNDPNKGAKSLKAMVSLEDVEKSNSMKSKG